MLDPETYPDIPSPSSQSFRTLEGDATPTPMRIGTPTPNRHADERSRLLDHSVDDVFVECSAEPPVERRRRPSTYSVINTGTTPTVRPDADVGEPLTYLVFASSHHLLNVNEAGPPGPSKPEAKKFPAGNWRKRMSYYVPVTSWIPGYSWSLYVSPCSHTVCFRPAVEKAESFLVQEPTLMIFGFLASAVTSSVG